MHASLYKSVCGFSWLFIHVMPCFTGNMMYAIFADILYILFGYSSFGQATMMKALESSVSKRKSCTNNDKAAVLTAWHRVDCRTREALRRNFLPELINNYEVIFSIVCHINYLLFLLILNFEVQVFYVQELVVVKCIHTQVNMK